MALLMTAETFEKYEKMDPDSKEIIQKSVYKFYVMPRRELLSQRSWRTSEKYITRQAKKPESPKKETEMLVNTEFIRAYEFRMGQTFELFSKLPPEIRDKIWKEALPGPRCVVLRHYPRAQRFFGGNDGEEGWCSPSKPPTILHVCCEARNVAKRQYSLSFSGKAKYQGFEARVWFDTKRDTVCIPGLRGGWSPDTIETIAGIGENLGDAENLRYLGLEDGFDRDFTNRFVVSTVRVAPESFREAKERTFAAFSKLEHFVRLRGTWTERSETAVGKKITSRCGFDRELQELTGIPILEGERVCLEPDVLY